MKRIVGHLFLLAIVLGLIRIGILSPVLAAPAGLDLKYTVAIDTPSNHLIHIQLDISNLNHSTLTLARLKDDGTPNILNLSVMDQDGNGLSYSVDNSLVLVELIHIDTSGKTAIKIAYDANLVFTDVGGNYSAWILDYAFGIVESQLILYQTVAEHIQSVQLEFNLPSGWNAITRFRDVDETRRPDPGDVMILFEGGTEYPLYIWGPMAFGNFDVYLRTVGEIEVNVAFYSDENDEESRIANRVFTIIDYATKTLGQLPQDARQAGFLYVFTDMTHGHIHNLKHEFGQVFFIDVGKVEGLKSLAHIIFHSWFQGNNEVPLWKTFHPEDIFGEGTIQYYFLKSLLKTELW